MPKEKPKIQEKAKKNIRRRELLKAGLLSGSAAILTSKNISANPAIVQNTTSDCPTTLEPFVDALPIMPIARPVRALNPAPTLAANIAGGEANRDDHQRFDEFFPKVLYDINISEGDHKFHRDLPPSKIWGHSNMGTPAITPGPTFMARYGQSVLVRRHNNLPADHVGFGSPEVTTHLHNGHTPSESDGNTDNWFVSGLSKDYVYPNIYAGYDTFPNIDPISRLRGDKREALGTLWYHDHRVMFTSGNVYKGLAGFYLLFDNQDSGNENDRNPNAFRLPSGRFDVPLIFQDKTFDSSCNLFFDQLDPNAFVGDKFAVNGKIQPFFRVARRKYRFRMLNGGPSRWYQLYLDPAPPNAPIVDGVPLPFTQIATDGNILTGPVPREFIRIGVARRDDVVIDFSKYKIGDQVFLTNRLQQIDGRGPVWDPATGQFVLDPPPGTPLLRFDVDYDAVDNSRVPETLRELPDLPDLTTVPETIIAFNRLGSAADPWSVRVTPPGGPAGTDFIYDGTPNPFLQQQPGGSTIWNLQNNSGLNPETWTHPIHHHLEESRILSRQVGVPGTTQFVDVPLPPEDLGGRKDVIELPPRNRVRIFFRFREFHGKYLLHCHNTVHEDHAMMARWDVVP